MSASQPSPTASLASPKPEPGDEYGDDGEDLCCQINRLDLLKYYILAESMFVPDLRARFPELAIQTCFIDTKLCRVRSKLL